MDDLALGGDGLSLNQYSISTMVDPNRPVAISELPDPQVMDRSTLGNMLPLQRNGWLAASSPPEDWRRRLVRLTNSARELVQTAKQSWVKAELSFQDAFGAEEARCLKDALTRLTSLVRLRLSASVPAEAAAKAFLPPPAVLNRGGREASAQS